MTKIEGWVYGALMVLGAVVLIATAPPPPKAFAQPASAEQDSEIVKRLDLVLMELKAIRRCACCEVVPAPVPDLLPGPTSADTGSSDRFTGGLMVVRFDMYDGEYQETMTLLKAAQEIRHFHGGQLVDIAEDLFDGGVGGTTAWNYIRRDRYDDYVRKHYNASSKTFSDLFEDEKIDIVGGMD